jgi:hypothetical protein
VWGYICSIYKRTLKCIKYIVLKFTPSTALFHLPPLIPGTVSAGIIFVFTYMCIHYLQLMHLPVPSPPQLSPLPPVSTSISLLLPAEPVLPISLLLPAEPVLPSCSQILQQKKQVGNPKLDVPTVEEPIK